jgi:TolB protein
MVLALTGVMVAAGCAQTTPRSDGMLGPAVALTDSSRFVKAGEAYFSSDSQRMIFQAIEQPAPGDEPAAHYSMFVGDVQYTNGMITGLEGITQVSPDGAANTCGWFYPGNSRRVLFSTTGSPPEEGPKPGYQRGEGSYLWAFPPQMNIVTRLQGPSGTWGEIEPILTDDSAYLAEASWSPDGRHVLYTSLATGEGDIYVLDTVTGATHLIVAAKGYDGGPFFSPEGDRICYRSDRRGDDYLQVFTADLARNDEGTIIGIHQEHTVTDDAFVNWCPFWEPTGESLVFATSEYGHGNYEIIEVSLDSTSPSRQRVTDTPGFDGLPSFDPQGRWMVWTSQQSDDGTSQLWVAPVIPSSKVSSR